MSVVYSENSLDRSRGSSSRIVVPSEESKKESGNGKKVSDAAQRQLGNSRRRAWGEQKPTADKHPVRGRAQSYAQFKEGRLQRKGSVKPSDAAPKAKNGVDGTLEDLIAARRRQGSSLKPSPLPPPLVSFPLPQAAVVRERSESPTDGFKAQPDVWIEDLDGFIEEEDDDPEKELADLQRRKLALLAKIYAEKEEERQKAEEAEASRRKKDD